MKRYYGNHPLHPLEADSFPTRLDPSKAVHRLLADLAEESNPHLDETVAFLPFPQSREEEDLLNILLLEEMAKEAAPQNQQETLEFLLNYGYFEERGLEAPEQPLALLFQEEAPMVTTTVLPSTSYTETVSHLKKPIEDRLIAEAEQKIRDEQEQIRQKVITQAEAAKEAPSPSKSKGKKTSSTPSQAAAAAALAPRELTEDEIKRKAKISVAVQKAKASGKFKDLLKVLNTLRLEDREERRRGSHHVVEGATGPVTLVHPHGGDRRIYPGRVRSIISRLSSKN